jgi:hypothetical protein
MNPELMLMCGLAAAGGWLLRHVGIGAGVKVPGAPPAAAAASTGRLPVMTTLKADIDQIVKSAVESAVKQAIDDIKSAALVPTSRST